MCCVMSIYSLAKENTRQLAHVHGLSKISVAIEKGKMVIELKSPAVDLVGFEHKAKTEYDINNVKKVQIQLEHNSDMFVLTGGSCELINTFIDLSNLINDINSAVPHQHHKQSNKENNTGNTHQEITANYYYHCEKTPELSSITINVFQLFPRVKNIQSMWITEKKQGAKLLNATNKTINLR
jgi:hypothetical protein